jgi:activator of Hsp90 ATPase-like protein
MLDAAETHDEVWNAAQRHQEISNRRSRDQERYVETQNTHDLGGDNGHFWGHVQAIKRPTLLEITGPLFMSSPVISNVQYRLKEVDGGTLLTLAHTALGFIQDDYREGFTKGWTAILKGVQRRAEAA